MNSVKIKNNQTIDKRSIPDLNTDQFLGEALKNSSSGLRPALMFGCIEEKNIRVYLAMSDDSNSIIHLNSTLFMQSNMKYESLTNNYPAFNLFERELNEEFGIEPQNHPFLKGVRYPHSGFNKKASMTDYPFYEINCEDIHQVAVGPVHAGVIEPGHFRFLCSGEKILHLELQLGYQHRGIEKMFKEGDITKKIQLAESVAGDTVIGHTYAYAQMIESALGFEMSNEILLERAIVLEMERIAVHIGDIGAIANDIAYMIGNAVSGANRTYVINTLLAICGSRFGRGFIEIGRNNFRIDGKRRELIIKNLRMVRDNMELLCEEMFDSPSVLSRLERAGIVTEKQAKECGFVGMAARASGLKLDTRADHPFGAYKKYPIYPLSLETGDVFARAYLRYLEIQQSMNYIEELLPLLKDESSGNSKPIGILQKNSFSLSLIEGWRGEICHALVTDDIGNVRYKIKDPSFTNWFALALSVRGNGISDFPLCNKSFNLSYSGNDL